MKKFLILALFVSIFFLGACASKNSTTNNEVASSTETVTEVSQDSLSMANPASVNCVTMKGTSKIVTKADGSQYGVCYFEDNRQCEEWALMRGECPLNGVKITGYDTEAQRFCAITGGTVDMKKGTCTKKETSCSLEIYYNTTGTCV